MVKSAASTVAQYLQELPPDRRELISTVRQLILDHLPPGYEERMNWGMITYEVPFERYPETYNGQPLGYVALAAQKNYCALYIMGIYQERSTEEYLREEYARAGRKLDMGKCCLRFRKLDDLMLEPIAQVIGATTPDQLIAHHEAVRRR
jgi:hypothetical protein